MSSTIASAKRTFVTIMIVCIGFVYFAIVQIERNSLAESKIVLSALVALKGAIGLPNVSPTVRDLVDHDLPTFSWQADAEYWPLYMRYLQFLVGNSDDKELLSVRKKLEDRFSSKPNGLGHFIADRPISYAVSKSCDLMTLKPDEKFEFSIFTTFLFGSAGVVKSENSYLIRAEQRCLHPRLPVPIMLVMPTNDGPTFVAIPDSVLAYFPMASLLRSDSTFELEESIANRLVPLSVQRYFPFVERFRVIDLRALDILILSQISAITGKTYEISDVTRALGEIHSEDVSKASFFGFSVTVVSFLSWVPVILLILSFVYWRQLRRISMSRIKQDEFWAPLDADDIIGLAVSHLWVAAPIVSILSVYFLYPDAFHLIFILGGREITPLGLLQWKLPIALPQGWYGLSYESILIIPLLVVQVLILVAIAKAGGIICKQTRSVSFRGIAMSWISKFSRRKI